MTLEDVRRLALSLPEAVESSHHGHPDFRVGKKIFATLQPARNVSVLRLPPALADSIGQERGPEFKVVSRGGGMGWLSVYLPAAEESDFFELLQIAHKCL